MLRLTAAPAAAEMQHTSCGLAAGAQCTLRLRYLRHLIVQQQLLLLLLLTLAPHLYVAASGGLRCTSRTATRSPH
jgi:hypothetical protein